MIPRYSRPEMAAIWTSESRFRIWFEIEAHATEALADLGVVPRSAANALWRWWATNPEIDVAAICHAAQRDQHGQFVDRREDDRRVGVVAVLDGRRADRPNMHTTRTTSVGERLADNPIEFGTDGLGQGRRCAHEALPIR